MATANYNRSIPDIFADLINQLTTLLRKEGQLARAEVSEKISQAGAGLAFIVVGAVLLTPALVVLFDAAVAALVAADIAAHWAALIVGGTALVIGLILLTLGLSRLKAERFVPNKTLHQLQEDARMAKQQVRQDHERAA
jgi:hypothetical protein